MDKNYHPKYLNVPKRVMMFRRDVFWTALGFVFVCLVFDCKKLAFLGGGGLLLILHKLFGSSDKQSKHIAQLKYRFLPASFVKLKRMPPSYKKIILR